ncbi:MAG TPA: MarR family transcriptional regulator [Gemmatimonadales bacterium]|jgi:DNA-binding MarR family transcriptional regulator
MGSATPAHTKAAVLGIIRAADVLRRRGAALFEPYGITLQQFNVLRILRGARPDGLCTLTIASRMIEQAPGITRLIDRLEAKQLVVRVRSSEDRRQVWCRITPTGLRLLARLDAPVAALDRQAVAGLARADQMRLAELLQLVHREPR